MVSPSASLRTGSAKQAGCDFNLPTTSIQRFFASLRMIMPVVVWCFNASTLLTIRSISSSAPGMGIAHNRNCPPYKNLRRFEADLADARRFSEILVGANHFQKDVWQLFRAAYSIIVLAALRIHPKDAWSADSKPGDRVPPKRETAHSPECRRRVIRR